MQIRCLYEGVTVEDMLASWATMLPSYMQQWALDRAAVSAEAQPPSWAPAAAPAAAALELL